MVLIPTPNPASTTWPLVVYFAQAMEYKLEKNRHKGDREGWFNTDPLDMIRRLKEEVAELEEAVTDWLVYGGDPTPILWESADTSNISMILADICHTLVAGMPYEEGS